MANGVNSGVIELVTTIVIVVTEAHCPTLGVNVYTAEPKILVLIKEGDQVPVTGAILLELVGNNPGMLFKQ